MYGDETAFTNDTPAEGIGSGASSAVAGPPTAAGAAGAPTATAATAGAPAAGAPAAVPSGNDNGEAEHHSGNIGARVLRSVLGALGGTEEVELSRDPQTGKMIETRSKSGPGQQWKRIIGGALAGFAGGVSVKPGPGHTMRAAGAGIQAGMKRGDAEQQGKMDMANEDFEAQQKATASKANAAMLNQQVAESAWRTTRQKAEFSTLANQAAQTMHNFIGADPSAEDMGQFASFADFLKTHGGNGAQLGQMNANRELAAVPLMGPDGTPGGVQIYRVNRAWSETYNEKPVDIPVGIDFDKEGKPKPVVQTIAAGGERNGRILEIAQSAWLKYAQAEADHQKGRSETEVTPKTRFTEEQQNRRSDTQAAAHVQAARIGAATKENAAGDKAIEKATGEVDKAYVKPANDVEKSFQMMDGAFKEFQQARAQGKELPTGAQSMLALSTHLATTFGNVKGSRVTRDMIQHHLGARSIPDSALVAIQKLTNGDTLSPDQWDAFHDLIGHSRRLSWEGAVKEATRKRVPINFIPEDLHGMAEEVSAPKGATAAVWSKDGRTLKGHIVGDQFVPLGGKE